MVVSLAVSVQLPALCLAAESGTQAVTIKDDVILLHPGTKLSKPDRKKLNEILSKFDKSLYKVEHLKDGKVTRTLGQLSDALIDKTIAAEAAEAKASGNSHATLQIIAAAASEQIYVTNAQEVPGASPSASTNPQRIQPTPTPTPPPNAAPSASTNPQRIQGPTPTATPPPNAMPSASTNPQRIQPTPTATPPPNAIPSASTNPQRVRTPIPSASTNPQHQAGAPAAGEKASRELIERLKPILEKYSSK